jgi:hypothetical protein
MAAMVTHVCVTRTLHTKHHNYYVYESEYSWRRWSTYATTVRRYRFEKSDYASDCASGIGSAYNKKQNSFISSFPRVMMSMMIQKNILL